MSPADNEKLTPALSIGKRSVLIAGLPGVNCEIIESDINVLLPYKFTKKCVPSTCNRYPPSSSCKMWTTFTTTGLDGAPGTVEAYALGTCETPINFTA